MQPLVEEVCLEAAHRLLVNLSNRLEEVYLANLLLRQRPRLAQERHPVCSELSPLAIPSAPQDSNNKANNSKIQTRSCLMLLDHFHYPQRKVPPIHSTSRPGNRILLLPTPTPLLPICSTI
jgi:hypothetical protein